MSAPPATERTLRRLFLTLFLRGRTSRGLNPESTPKSVGSKLALTLVLYALVGLVGLFFLHKPVFALSLYLHAMTLMFLGMFVAASAGEVLFNREEADILMHRPVTARALLRAKVGVLVQVSLWLAGALNLAGFFVGLAAEDGGWGFPLVHVISTTLEALFCTGGVVLVYQLCLRWFGRERLDGLMTAAQVLVAVAAVVGGQIVPHLMRRFGERISLVDSWWIGLLPPAWFAGFDDALAGGGAPGSWLFRGHVAEHLRSLRHRGCQRPPQRGGSPQRFRGAEGRDAQAEDGQLADSLHPHHRVVVRFVGSGVDLLAGEKHVALGPMHLQVAGLHGVDPDAAHPGADRRRQTDAVPATSPKTSHSGLAEPILRPSTSGEKMIRRSVEVSVPPPLDS